MTLRILPGTGTADFPDRWIDGDGIKWVESSPMGKEISLIHHIPKGTHVEGVKMGFVQVQAAFPGMLENCLEWNGGVPPAKPILLNHSLVIKVAQLNEKTFEVHFKDGDTLKLVTLPLTLSKLMGT